MTPEEFVDRARLDRKFSVKELGERSGLPYQHLARCLQGKTHFRLYEYLALCALLKLDPRAYRHDGEEREKEDAAPAEKTQTQRMEELRKTLNADFGEEPAVKVLYQAEDA